MSIPLPRVYWPVTLTGTLIAWFGGGSNRTGAVAVGPYYDPESLVTAVLAAMNTTEGPGTYSASILADGRITFTRVSGTWFFRFSAAACPVAPYIGFSNLNGSANTAQTSDFPMQNLWLPNVAPTNDTGDIYEYPGNVQTMSMGGSNKYIAETTVTLRNVSFDFLLPEVTLIRREATTANTNKALERLWLVGAARFRYWADRTVTATYADYFLTQDAVVEFKPTRLQTKEIYSISIPMRKYV
jgi:hypothetical protein